MTLETTTERRSVERLRHAGAEPIKFGFDGLPDQLVRWGRGLHFWIEFKKERTGRYRVMQKVWRKHLLATGDHHYTVETFEQTLDIIAAWEMAHGPASAIAV